MKTTYYTIAEAKAINANILTIERLQRAYYLLNATKSDLMEAEKENDSEMIEIEKYDIERQEKLIQVIKSKLSDDDILFSEKNDVYLIEGDGGKDRVRIEKI